MAVYTVSTLSNFDWTIASSCRNVKLEGSSCRIIKNQLEVFKGGHMAWKLKELQHLL